METAGKRRRLAAYLLLSAAFLLFLGLSLLCGSMALKPGEILSALLGEDEGAAGQVILRLRLPRALAAALLGGALSVSGYLLQTFFGNPVAGPYVLGISSGAKLSVSIVMVFALQRLGSLSFPLMMTAAFAGSMAVTLLILLFSGRSRSMATLLVVGLMVGNICSAVTDFFVTFADEAGVANLHAWSQGSFSGVSRESLLRIAPVVLAALVAVRLLAKPISAYRLGETYAASMGVNVRVFRSVLIALSSLLSACVTALTGPISFVGVAVPQLSRMLLGSSAPEAMIPGTFLLGAVFCMGCDLIARTAFAPTELAVSTVTAFFGAPVVIALMLHRGARREEA